MKYSLPRHFSTTFSILILSKIVVALKLFFYNTQQAGGWGLGISKSENPGNLLASPVTGTKQNSQKNKKLKIIAIFIEKKLLSTACKNWQFVKYITNKQLEVGLRTTTAVARVDVTKITVESWLNFLELLQIHFLFPLFSFLVQ